MKNFDFKDAIWHMENESAYVEEAPKQVQYTITPIGDKAALMQWRLEQLEKEEKWKVAKAKAAATRRNRAIEKWMEANKEMEAPSAKEQQEYEYRKSRTAYLNYVDKQTYGKQNHVICWKCKETTVINTVLGNDFYFCQNCREEVK